MSLAYTAPSGSSAALTILVGGGISAYTPAVPAQTSGTVRYRNANITLSGSRLEYSGGDFNVSAGSVLATAFVTSSDSRIKENTNDLSEQAAMAVMNSVSPKTYNRTDIPGARIGFLAQDIAEAIPEEWGNVVHQANGLLALDYARLTPILWSVCKNLDARIKALEGA
jgi:hypothetical protein